jgi:glucose/mannose-6-phosphate isomerase
MNLDDMDLLSKIDTQHMIDEINTLPDQLSAAWNLGSTFPLPNIQKIDLVVVSGMGGSAIGADLLRSYVLGKCPVPVIVHRDYGLPSFAKGEGTLFIASSHSGNTEETLDSLEAAMQAGCTCMVISTGGKLLEVANQNKLPCWIFEHSGQPRAAVGYSFGILLSLFTRLGLIEEQAEIIQATVSGMKAAQNFYYPHVPAAVNPAKRYAGQLVGRWVTVFGSGLLSVVGARWKGQINELAKAPANVEVLPEADHNTLAGIINPGDELLSPKTFSMFLVGDHDHPRNALRIAITRQTFMLEGLNTDLYTAKGSSALEQMWTAIHFGDYMAYYLAIAYGVDPTPVDALVTLKRTLSGRK